MTWAELERMLKQAPNCKFKGYSNGHVWRLNVETGGNMKCVYPCVLRFKEGYGYSVIFPDFAGGTQGDSLYEALETAEDFLSFAVVSALDDGDRLPEFTPFDKIEVPKGAFVTLIKCDTDEYRRKIEGCLFPAHRGGNMKYVYPAIFQKSNEPADFWEVDFPDIDVVGTCGYSLYEAMEDAEDTLGYAMCCHEDLKDDDVCTRVDPPTPIEKVKVAIGEHFSTAFVTLIKVDTDEYRRKIENEGRQ